MTNLVKCPYCAELIQPEAIFCRFCRKALPAKSHNPSSPPLVAVQQVTKPALPYRDGQVSVDLTGVAVRNKVYSIRRIARVRIIERGRRYAVEIETTAGNKFQIFESESKARADKLADAIAGVCNMEEVARGGSESSPSVTTETSRQSAGCRRYGCSLVGLIALLAVLGITIQIATSPSTSRTMNPTATRIDTREAATAEEKTRVAEENGGNSANAVAPEATSWPTDTPEPTVTAGPTETPEPTETVGPTETPEPTPLPTSTFTPDEVIQSGVQEICSSRFTSAYDSGDGTDGYLVYCKWSDNIAMNSAMEDSIRITKLVFANRSDYKWISVQFLESRRTNSGKLMDYPAFTFMMEKQLFNKIDWNSVSTLEVTRRLHSLTLLGSDAGSVSVKDALQQALSDYLGQ